MSKYAKGPWFQHTTDTIYQDITAEPEGNGESIAHVFHQGDFVTGVANADLIAAAPELYEAAKWAAMGEHHSNCSYRKKPGHPTRCNCYVGACQTAIAKAEGGSHG